MSYYDNQDYQDQGYYDPYTPPPTAQNNDSLKNEVFTALQSMGYNYFLIEKAYSRAPIKTTEGVLSYITDNPRLQEEVELDLQAQEAMLYSESEAQQREQEIKKQSFEEEAYRKLPNVGFIDPVLKQTLMLMGYEDYMVIAALQATNSVSADAAVAWIIDNGYKIPKPQSPVRKFEKKIEKKVVKTQPYSGPVYRSKNDYTKKEEVIQKRVLKSNASNPGYERKPAQQPKNKSIIGNVPDSHSPDNQRFTHSSSIYNKKPEHIESTPIEEIKENPIDEMEARRQAMLLQAKARERQNQREKATEIDDEKRRREQTKELQEAKRLQEEANLRINLERIEREKKEKEDRKKEILKQIAIDKARKAGKDISEVEEMFKEERTVQEKFDEIFDKMVKIYTLEGVEGQKLKTCLTTCMIYLSKISQFFYKFFLNKLNFLLIIF